MHKMLYCNWKVVCIRGCPQSILFINWFSLRVFYISEIFHAQSLSQLFFFLRLRHVFFSLIMIIEKNFFIITPFLISSGNFQKKKKFTDSKDSISEVFLVLEILALEALRMDYTWDGNFTMGRNRHGSLKPIFLVGMSFYLWNSCFKILILDSCQHLKDSLYKLVFGNPKKFGFNFPNLFKLIFFITP